MLFLLNGHKAQQDVSLARAKPPSLEVRGITTTVMRTRGIIPSAVWASWSVGIHQWKRGLLKAVSYLTKIDACARLMLPGNARTFGRGEIIPLKTGQRRK